MQAPLSNNLDFGVDAEESLIGLLWGDKLGGRMGPSRQPPVRDLRDIPTSYMAHIGHDNFCIV